MSLKLVKKGKIFHISGTVNGRRHRESTHTSSREHAEAKRKQVERDLEDRAYLRLANFADAVIIYQEKGGEVRFLRPLMDRFEATPLRDITPAAVSMFSQEKYGHLEASTIKRHLYVPLNAVMQCAHEADLCPPVKFKSPKVKKNPVDYANDQWLRTFLEGAHSRIALTVLFLTLTAARVGEACNLTLADVDLPRRFAVLRKTKNGNSRRVILPQLLVDALGAWTADRKITERDAKIFGYAGRWSVNQAIRRVCVKIGLSYKSSHKLGRHAFAARLLAEGKSLRFVQEAGGWQQIKLVAETYGHLEQSAIDDQLRESGDCLMVKMGSLPAPPAEPTRDWQEIAAVPSDAKLIEAIRERHVADMNG